MAAKEKQLGEAEAVRASHKAAFARNEAELETSISELERATNELKHAGGDGSLLQLRGKPRAPAQKLALKSVMTALKSIFDASWVNAGSKRQIQGLMQTEAERRMAATWSCTPSPRSSRTGWHRRHPHGHGGQGDGAGAPAQLDGRLHGLHEDRGGEPEALGHGGTEDESVGVQVR